MHFVMFRGTGVKLGMGIGVSPRVLRAYLQSDPIKGQMSPRGHVALEMPHGTKFGRKSP